MTGPRRLSWLMYLEPPSWVTGKLVPWKQGPHPVRKRWQEHGSREGAVSRAGGTLRLHRERGGPASVQIGASNMLIALLLDTAS